MLQNISTLVFDLDGTLSDPSLGIGRCLNYALAAHGIPEVSLAEIAAAIGPPLDDTFRKFSPAADLAVISSLVSKYRERYADIGYAENQLYPGIAKVLQVLAANGIRMGVCTSKRRDFAEKILEMFGLHAHFHFIDGGDVGIRKRDQLAALLQSGEIDPSAIMIGDREVDISSARANGLRSIGVLWGFGDRDELHGAGPDVLLTSTNELEQLGR